MLFFRNLKCMKFSRIDPIWLYEAKKSISTESLVHSPHLELNGELISLSMHTGSQNMNPQMATLLFVAPTSGHLTLHIDFGS